MNAEQKEARDVLRDFMRAEIGVLQGIINRLGSNSFLIKGWAITLVVVTLLLKGDRYQILIAFIPLLVFWFLDAYFLHQERMYRKLYEWVIHNRLKTDDYLFDMNAYRFKDAVQSIPGIMFSITLGPFYGSIALLVLIYATITFLFANGGY